MRVNEFRLFCFVNQTTMNLSALRNLDALIVATTSPDMPSPATAHRLHGKLNLLGHVHCFDVSSSCTSFLSALRAGIGIMERQVLIIATECKQKTLNQADLRTRSLFGDGAAGILLEPSDGTEAFAFPYVCSNSSAVHRIQIPVGGSVEPFTASNLHRVGLELNEPKSTFFLIVNQFVLAIQSAWDARRP